MQHKGPDGGLLGVVLGQQPAFLKKPGEQALGAEPPQHAAKGQVRVLGKEFGVGQDAFFGDFLLDAGGCVGHDDHVAD